MKKGRDFKVTIDNLILIVIIVIYQFFKFDIKLIANTTFLTFSKLIFMHY